MEIKKMQAFIAVMKYHNLAEASAATYISESSISKYISSMENEFNTKFFIRKSHGLFPTDSAYLYYAYAKDALENYKNLESKIYCRQEISGRILRIATAPVLSEYGLTEVAYQFMKKYPEIRCCACPAYSRDINRMLIEEKAQIAIGYESLLDTTVLDVMKITDDRLCAIVPQSHHFAGLNYVTVNDLKNEMIVMPSEGSLPYTLINEACRNHGFNPKIALCVSRSNALIDFVEYGLGVSLLMTKAAKTACSGRAVSIIPLKENISDSLALVKTKSEVPVESVDLFWNFFSQYTK